MALQRQKSLFSQKSTVVDTEKIAAEALNKVQTHFTDQETYILRAWLRHFDVDHDMQISFREFCGGMGSMSFEGDAADLFRAIDKDESGVIALDEIDAESAKLWIDFRKWCVQIFDDSNDFIKKLSNGSDFIRFPDFQANLQAFLWDGGQEDVLFKSIDVHDLGYITLHYLKWFELDKKRQKRKAEAKVISVKQAKKKEQSRRNIIEAVRQFKAFLMHRHLSYLRAWRRALDLDGSMMCQKTEFFKAVKEMNWVGDVRHLWKGIDKDDSCVTSFEEIDLKGALQLARFKDFCTEKFGSVVQAFHAFDIVKKGKLTEPEFVDACKKHGFRHVTKSLFLGLDHQSRKFITDKDLIFADQWKKPPYLTCKPNEQAAKEFKDALLDQYRHFVKAWRACIDKDSSNRASFNELEAAARTIRFKGDIAGVYRSLDSDLSGFVTLKEIDPEASDQIVAFKIWCDEEFGSVKTCFKFFDKDGSDELSYTEFKRSCASYGCPVNAKRLFSALDVDQQGSISHNEIAFIDEWDLTEEAESQSRGPSKEGNMMLNMLGGMLGGSGSKKKKMTAKEQVKFCPIRIQDLARPRTQERKYDARGQRILPMSSESWFIKPRSGPMKSPYLKPVTPRMTPSASMRSLTSVTSVGASTPAVSSEAAEKILHLQMLREKIISNQPLQVPEPVQEHNDEHVDQGNFLSFASLRSKTVALRSRTLKILGKVDIWERPMTSGMLDSTSASCWGTWGNSATIQQVPSLGAFEGSLLSPGLNSTLNLTPLKVTTDEAARLTQKYTR